MSGRGSASVPFARDPPSGRSDAIAPTGAGALLKAVGLLPDGPLLWGAQLAARGPGVYLVEWPVPAREAPIDPLRTRQWLERVETLRLDGRRPTQTELGDRLASFWLPSQTVLFVGAAPRSVAGRVAALLATPLGDARPYPGGHWLRALMGIERARLWWAESDAPEEYADALLGAFTESVPDDDRARLPSPEPVLPFANLETITGQRKQHGITGALVAGSAPATPTAKEKTAARAASARAAARRASAPTTRARRPAAAAPGMRAAPTHLSAEGLARLGAELEELRTRRRPEVIARVKAARELGDLRENADYEAARNEQSFLEGRIQALEAMVDSAEVIDESRRGEEVVLGSRVVVSSDGESMTYRIVGSSEADPAAGRISGGSPVGRALLGRRAGDEIQVALPSGTVTYRVQEVG